MKTLIFRASGAILSLACAAAAAQQSPASAPRPAAPGPRAAAPGPSAAAPAAPAASGPAIGKVLQEAAAPVPGGKPGETTRIFKPLPEGAYRFEQGEYRSAVSGLTMKLPQLRDEKVVSVREAVISQRDGEVATSHIMFVPGPEGETVDPHGPVSAVVVTRLRQDRPHDRETVLRAWEPRTPEQRKAMEAQGVEFSRIGTGLGEGLERVVPNRIADLNFPYRTHTDPDAKQQLKSVGVTRYLVSQDSALLEFSQVFPCRELAPAACKAEALRASDRFVQGVSNFVMFRSTPQAKNAASQPHNHAPQPQGKASQPQAK